MPRAQIALMAAKLSNSVTILHEVVPSRHMPKSDREIGLSVTSFTDPAYPTARTACSAATEERRDRLADGRARTAAHWATRPGVHPKGRPTEHPWAAERMGRRRSPASRSPPPEPAAATDRGRARP